MPNRFYRYGHPSSTYGIVWDTKPQPGFKAYRYQVRAYNADLIRMCAREETIYCYNDDIAQELLDYWNALGKPGTHHRITYLYDAMKEDNHDYWGVEISVAGSDDAHAETSGIPCG